jgi:hypothetical protein
MNRLPAPTAEAPEDFTALYVTNFSPHHDGDDLATAGSWLATLPIYVRHALAHDLHPALQRALNTYGRVPSFGPDGTLLG